MNRPKDQAAIEKTIVRVLEKHNAPFVTLKKFLNSLEINELQNLGLNKSSPQDAVKTALSPLAPPYRFAKFKGSVFLLSGPFENVALDYIRIKNGRTFKQLNNYFPMVKESFREVVNGLLDKGMVKARLSKSDLPVLFLADKETEVPAPEPVGTESAPEVSATGNEDAGLSEIELFKSAYDEAGKGSNYVFIHEIRRRLGWPREKFDELLYRLMTEGYLAAHPGNPGALDVEDVKDSFQDEFGDLYITVTWRKPV